MTHLKETSTPEILVLNPDLEILPVSDFPKHVRDLLGGLPTDFILSDRSSRIGSQRIESETAMLLARFREPCRIVEAVFEHSVEVKIDPAQLLNDVYPFLTHLRQSTILIDPGAVISTSRGPGLNPNQQFETYRIVAVVSELAETGIYKAEASDGRSVIIKYIRKGAEASIRDNLKREVGILTFAREKSCVSQPRVNDYEFDRDDPFASIEWIDGQTLYDVDVGRLPVSRRLGIVGSLLDAYSELHRAGILHGDVHSRNVMVVDDNAVRLIDFGGARFVHSEDDYPRIGLIHFYEPEVARAVLEQRPPPLPTLKGEQYNVAGLVYLILTGAPYTMLSLETETALEQIAHQPPRSFSSVGLRWDSIEQVLARALSKFPEERFDSIDEFAVAIRNALKSEPAPRCTATSRDSTSSRRGSSSRNLPDSLRSNLQIINDQYGLSSDLIRFGLTSAPTASIYGGAAGVAYAMLRLGCLTNDPAALAAADVWISHAMNERASSVAYWDGSIREGNDTGQLALFHSATGLYLVQALVRHAACDELEATLAISGFISAIRKELDPGKFVDSFTLDATNGFASLLLGSSLLQSIVNRNSEAHKALVTLARELKIIVERQLHTDFPKLNRFVGVAHGMSGAVLSLLRWSEASGDSVRARTIDAVEQIVRLGTRRGKSMTWPIEATVPKSASWTGWCHGSAGHLLTLTAAARVLDRSDFLESAIAAGEHIWIEQGSSGPSLCCGLAGEALALFELGRASGSNLWIDRGRKLASRAVVEMEQCTSAHGLFRSPLGIRLAATEALYPETASWPIFDSPL